MRPDYLRWSSAPTAREIIYGACYASIPFALVLILSIAFGGI